MGFNSENYSVRGSFLVLTSDTSPFCGKFLITIFAIFWTLIIYLIFINYYILDVSANDKTEIERQLREDFADNYQD